MKKVCASKYLELIVPVIAIAITVGLSGCQNIQSRPNRSRSFKDLLGLRDQSERDFQDQLVQNSDPLGQRSYNRLLVDDLSPGNLATTFQVRTTYKEDPAAAEAAYQEGKSFYHQAIETLEANPEGTGHIDIFLSAANKFRLAAGTYPDSQLEQDSLYFEGRSFFFANKYVQANRAYENLIARYAGSRYLDNAEAHRFAIAEYWLQLAKVGPAIKLNDPSRPKTGLAKEARRIFHRIRLDDPTGKLADDATLALANAYFQAGNWLDAADTYEDLRRNYPGSQHQFHAHMFELKARLNSYQGRSYDDAPLVKADKLLKQMVQQFPNEARKEDEYLSKEAGMIRHLLAEREWGMAEYFSNLGENQAAQYYYEQVAANFSDTQFGEQVGAELNRVKELPAKPKQQAEWLVNMFPEREEAKPVVASRPTSLIR